MVKRLELQKELVEVVPNVYFQPPSNIKMKYPCIVYKKTGKNRHFASDVIYLSQQGYQLTVIDKNPDSTIADELENRFQHCGIDQYFVTDDLYHTTLSLYY